MQDAKPLFKSRSALFALLTIVLGAAGMENETVSAFLREHAEIILLGIGALNLLLRRLTHERVALLPPPEPEDFYH